MNELYMTVLAQCIAAQLVGRNSLTMPQAHREQIVKLADQLAREAVKQCQE